MSASGDVGGDRLLAALAREALARGVAAWLVGGAVRDRILGRAPVDLDVSIEGGPRDVAHVASSLARLGWTSLARHERFGTATVRGPGGERIDLAATREESYPHPGALPIVRTGVSIGRDLARRDFTIHAMAVALGPDGPSGALVDPFAGEADLAARRVRLLHEDSLSDDPTRVFRAARYAARLGFELDAAIGIATSRAIASGAFGRISGDRLRRALQELLSEENRGVAMELLGRLGVPSAVVAGWEVSAEGLRSLAAAADVDDAWRRLLGPVSPGLHDRIATRLSFSRTLRRASGSRA